MQGGFKNPIAYIPDGSISELKIADGAITVTKLADGSVSTVKIADLAVNTAKIADLAISTAKIANAAITNAKIDTLSASKITSGTISAQTITISSTGEIQSPNKWSIDKDRFYIGDTTNYLELSPDRFNIGPTVVFGAGGGNTVTNGSEIRLAWVKDTGVSTKGYLDMVLAWNAGGGIQLAADILNYRNGIWYLGQHSSGNYAKLYASQVKVSDGNLASPGLIFDDSNTGIWRNTDPSYDGNSVAIGIDGSNAFAFGKSGSESRMRFNEFNDWVSYDGVTEQYKIVIGTNDEFILGQTGLFVPNVYSATTSGGAGYVRVVDSAGQLVRYTSSERYKKNIKPWQGKESVLSLTPITFKSKQKLDDSRKVWLGLTAEDVAKHFPKAAIYDDKGRPDSIDWNPIVAGLLHEVKKLRQDVDSLQAA